MLLELSHRHAAVACPNFAVLEETLGSMPSQKTPQLTLPPIDFWGPVSNFGIPLAAVADTQKSPELYVRAARLP